MATSLPTSLTEALDLPLLFSPEVTVQLSPDLAMASGMDNRPIYVQLKLTQL